MAKIRNQFHGSKDKKGSKVLFYASKTKFTELGPLEATDNLIKVCEQHVFQANEECLQKKTQYETFHNFFIQAVFCDCRPPKSSKCHIT